MCKRSWGKLVLLECALRPPPPSPQPREDVRSPHAVSRSCASGLQELACVRELAARVEKLLVDPVEHSHLTLLALLSGCVQLSRSYLIRCSYSLLADCVHAVAVHCAEVWRRVRFRTTCS